jgi:nitroreductase
MEFSELICKRESIRNYDPDRPVPQEVLRRILEAGRLAPSAANRQPWKFLLISSKEMLSKVRECYDRQWYKDAPHILVVLGDINKAWKRSYDGYCSIETDLTIAMDHLILAAENEGVGTCWISNFKPELLKKALDLKDNERVFDITPLGYPREDFKKKGVKDRKQFEEVVSFL